MAKERLDFIISASVAEFSASVKKAKGDLKSLADAVKDSKAGLNRGVTATAGEKAARVEAEALLATIKKLSAAERELTREQKARLAGQVAGYKAALQAAAPTAQATVAAKQQATAQKQFILEQRALEAASRAQARQAREEANSTITLRYALYDVGSTAQQASQALLTFARSAFEAQVAQEQAFSQIEKTLVGVADQKALDSLKQQLVDLSTQIPVSFGELSKIGMLGSQLGIASGDIANFTEVVAKFSAITGMSVEETAMGFGKIANLLGLSADQYASLGSAIAKVGVSSAATEQQIINTAGQIGAVGKAAGFSASEIIGLSASMASLKIAPEEARGVLIQTFHQMDAAARTFNEGIGQGGERLRIFADIAGISSEEFARGWGDKTNGGASKVWEKFIRGLGDRNISRSLVQIGLDGVRTSKGLTALANSADSIFGPNGTLALARTAGMGGGFLDESFGTIVSTLASKLEMLQNSFENLFASMLSDSAALDVVGFIIDSIKNLNTALSNLFSKNQFAASVGAVIIGLTALAGVVLSLIATLAIGTASFFAVRTALAGLATEGNIVRGTFAGMIASLLGVVPAARAANVEFVGMAGSSRLAALGITSTATAMRVLKYAMVSTGIGALVVILGELAAVLMQASDESENTSSGLDDVQKAVKKTGEEAASASSELQGFIDLVMLEGKNTLGVEGALYSLGQALQKGKADFSEYTVAGRANIAALQSTISAYTTAANGDQQVLANNLQALYNFMIAGGYATAESLAVVQNAILATGKTAQGVVINFASLIDGFKATTTSAGTTKTALEKLDEVLQKVFRGYDVKIGLMDSLDSLGQSIADNGKLFGYGTAGMRDNLKALEDTISAFKDSSDGDLTVFRGNLLSLRAAMQKLAVTGGPALSLINAALAKTGSKGKASAKEIAAIFNAISGSIKKNAKTISDYVGDLNSVLSNAFSNRYGTAEAMDKITSAFDDMTASANDARQAIADAQNEIAGIKADKNILEYQLSVAVRYGDTLRAEAIRAKLAKANASLAEQEKKITDNQQTLNKTLTGTSASAVENRSKLRELVQAGNSYLLTLAQSGMSSADLQVEAKKLADDFLQQGKNLGFAEGELKTYLDAFTKDFSAVVTSVPKDITITVDTDPALQAIKDFVKNANDAMAGLTGNSTAGGVTDIKTKSTTGTSSGTSTAAPKATNSIPPKPTANPGAGWTWSYNASKKSWDKVPAVDTSKTPSPSGLAEYLSNYAALKKEMDEWNKKDWFAQMVTKIPHAAVLDGLLKKIGNFEATVGSLKYKPYDVKVGYATGGLVQGPGTATSDSIPTRVSSGEYIVQANAVRYYGADFMNALNNIQVQRQSYSGSSNGSSGMVYLSPEDRQLLRAAIERPINLYADSKQLASTVSNGNASLARRGLN